MASILKRWRDAATLIVAAKSAKPLDNFDYRLLTLRRHGKSNFMPNSYVFPGGVVDKADFANEWLDLYSENGLRSALSSILNISGNRPPMFTTKRDSKVPNELGYRISAIRETFEESGVLLVTDPKNVTEHRQGALKLASLGQIRHGELEQWRNRVSRNANVFIELCRSLHCVPDLWSLSEWSDWLTPSDLQPRRYDTAFFICCIDGAPTALIDDKEVVDLKWVTPTEALDDHKKEKLFLGPPQVYEIARLLNFQKLDTLCRFSVERQKAGLELWLPVRYNTTNGILSVLPGDSMYPVNPDFTGDKDIVDLNQTLYENRQSSKHLHRTEFRGVHDSATYCNIELPYGQISALTYPSDCNQNKAKL
ncbi:acyl-coenzyme A diphosphatase NUDT19-like [Glandiceps talaboti]